MRKILSWQGKKIGVVCIIRQIAMPSNDSESFLQRIEWNRTKTGRVYDDGIFRLPFRNRRFAACTTDLAGWLSVFTCKSDWKNVFYFRLVKDNPDENNKIFTAGEYPVNAGLDFLNENRLYRKPESGIFYRDFIIEWWFPATSCAVFFIFDTSLVMLFFAYDGCSVNSDYTGWKNGKEKNKIKIW